MWYLLPDDNTPYSVEKNKRDLEAKLQKASVKPLKLFCGNGMKTKQDKCHFLSSLDISTKFPLHACRLEKSDSQKILGATIDR